MATMYWAKALRGLVALLVLSNGLAACADERDATARGYDRHHPQPDRVSVMGRGLVEVVPDKVSFVVGVDARAEDAEIAYRSVEDTLGDVIAALRRLDIDEQHVQAMMVNLNPVIDYKQRNKVIAYEVRRDVRVTVNNIDSYGRAIKALSSLGITRFQQVSMASSEADALKVEALAKAFDNAREKAEQLARRAGRELGGVEWMRESGVQQPPRPYEMAAARLAVSDAGAGSSPVSGGLIALQSSVEVGFRLK